MSTMAAVAAYVVTDTAGILAVLLDEPEKEAVVEAAIDARARATVGNGLREGDDPGARRDLRLTNPHAVTASRIPSGERRHSAATILTVASRTSSYMRQSFGPLR